MANVPPPLSLDAATVPESLSSATAKWVIALHEWNDAQQFTVPTLELFASGGDANSSPSTTTAAARKAAYVAALVRTVSHAHVDLWSALGADAVLKCLRILSRDKLAVDALLAADFAAWLLELCQLPRVAADAAADSAFALDDLRTEAWALLVNLTVNPGASSLLAALAERRAHRVTLAKLQLSGDADYALFSRYRLLLQLAAKRDDVSRELLELGLLPLLARKLRALLQHKSSMQIDSALRQLSIDGLSYVEDLFRCCFVVTVQYGPVGRKAPSDAPPTPLAGENLSALFEVLEYARLVLRNEPIPAAQRAASVLLARVHGVRAGAVSCLLNTPVGDESIELMQRGQVAADGSDVSFIVLHLDNMLRDPSDAPRDQLVTLLMLVNRMARAHGDIRNELRQVVFPDAKYGRDLVRVGVEVPYADEDSMTNRLIKLMSDANPAVSHYAQDLLYGLCGDNGEEFTRVVGFGSAAGLLAMRGLMKLPDDPLDKKPASAAASSSSSSSSSSEPSAASPALSDDAMRLMRQLNAKPEGESEDARAIRQGRAMHDLEKMGVLKMVRKDDAVTTTPAAAAAVARCAACGAPNAPMRCAACQAVRYCSRDCQKSDWSMHKRYCQKKQ